MTTLKLIENGKERVFEMIKLCGFNMGELCIPLIDGMNIEILDDKNKSINKYYKLKEIKQKQTDFIEKEEKEYKGELFDGKEIIVLDDNKKADYFIRD